MSRYIWELNVAIFVSSLAVPKVVILTNLFASNDKNFVNKIAFHLNMYMYEFYLAAKSELYIFYSKNKRNLQ